MPRLVKTWRKLRHNIGSSDIVLFETCEICLVIIVKVQTGITRALLPFVTLGPCSTSTFLHTVKTVCEFFEGNVKGCTLCLKLGFLVLQVDDVLMCTLKDGTFVFLGARDDLCNVLDAFIDDFTATSFN